jgi:methionyl-tRNA formyltransferase
MTSRLRILFLGSGEFGLPTLKALRSAGHDLVHVVSQPDRPAGRGRKTIPTPISQYALAECLPLLRTPNISVETLPACDVMVVIAFGQKISPQVANAPRLGSLNLHASLLPKCRGAAPINWTIIRGELVTGNSIIRLADKMDAGALLAQSRLEIAPLETAGELHDRLSEDGAPLVLQTVDQLASGTAVETPQDHSLATLAPKLGRQDTVLDFAATPAKALADRIRGLFPWPGCRTQLLDAAGQSLARLTLVRVRPVQGEGPRWRPGEITTQGAISIGTGEEALEVVELQPEGRTLMPLSAYRHGHPWMPGMRVESAV